MKKHTGMTLLGATALASMIVASPPLAAQAQETAPPLEEIIVTGSRIPRADLVASSPVAVTSQAQIRLDRALTVEDFTSKLPQLAGGVNSTSTGSDAYGAQTLDLRGLGQNRTLVLVNGTRAAPFSFRNAADVNAIPAPLLERVEVLTGGAAAVYGADAVAGVVNFIISDSFEGIEVGGTYETADGGGSRYGAHVAFGSGIGDRGSIVGYLGYSEREVLRAGERDWAMINPATVAGRGGNFTDVASGNTFSFDEAGNFTRTPQTTTFQDEYILVQPLERFNASTFFTYDLLENVEAYGRGMFTNVQTTGAGRVGSQPVVINEVVTITADNPFLPDAARALLTFQDGAARVRVQRSLGELGIITAETERNTYQAQFGLRGPITDSIDWDIYGQYGRVEEETTVKGDGLRVNAAGMSRFAALANTVDIFGPGADLSSLGNDFQRDLREREQIIGAAVLSGSSAGLFELPAGPIGFALGYEYREENGDITHGAGLLGGLSYRQGTEVPISGSFDSNEVYGELLIPVIGDLPFVQAFDLELAYRISDYSNVGSYDTSKIGANWAVNDDIRVRGSRQKVIRAPNIGEFAAPQASIPLSLLVTVPRLAPRYGGDPCALGTGDPAQCQRFGAPAAGYDSLDPANLVGDYVFGGNPDIGPEEGTTWTIGAVIQPSALDGFSATIDYYDIEIDGAVGVIQPVDALTSCYIIDPDPDNPLCQAVTRDPQTGFILDAFPIDRNLAKIIQRGVDVGLTYTHDLDFGGAGSALTLSYNANIVTDYTIQRNAVLDPIDCKGTYGFACSTDGVSLVFADYQHRAAVTWDNDMITAQLGWQRIGGVEDSALNSNGEIDAQDYFDASVAVEAVEGVRVTVGVSNIFDKDPPLPVNAGAFNTFPGTYDVVGRTFGVSLVIRR